MQRYGLEVVSSRTIHETGHGGDRQAGPLHQRSAILITAAATTLVPGSPRPHVLPISRAVAIASFRASRCGGVAAALTTIVLLALNLRTLVASLPPLLSHVRADLGLSGLPPAC
jgi:hypothetical protein